MRFDIISITPNKKNYLLKRKKLFSSFSFHGNKLEFFENNQYLLKIKNWIQANNHDSMIKFFFIYKEKYVQQKTFGWNLLNSNMLGTRKIWNIKFVLFCLGCPSIWARPFKRLLNFMYIQFNEQEAKETSPKGSFLNFLKHHQYWQHGSPLLCSWF